MQHRPGNRRYASSHSCATLLAAALVAVASLTSGPARGQSLGVELDLGIPVGDTSDVLDLGWGFGVRAGYGLPIPAITFDIEAIFQHYWFPVEAIDETAGLWRLAAGLRVGFGIPVMPELFGHLGYGSTSIETELGEAEQDGLTWDLGISSNLVELAVLAFGVHLAYVKLVPDDPTTYLAFGIHGEFGF